MGPLRKTHTGRPLAPASTQVLDTRRPEEPEPFSRAERGLRTRERHPALCARSVKREPDGPSRTHRGLGPFTPFAHAVVGTVDARRAASATLPRRSRA